MNKKVLTLMLLMIGVFVCFTACVVNEDETIASENVSEKQSESSSVKNADKNVGGTDGDFDSPYDGYKYRAIYYDVPAPFVELVDKVAFGDWFRETPYRVYPLDVDEMAMVAFIKKFNISREDFDKANEKSKQIILKYSGEVVMNPAEDDPYYDRAIESKEIYNADIIYTFDNELINAYYLYVDPYEDESSTNEHIHDIEDCNCGADFTLDDMPMRYMYYSLTYPHAQLVEDKEAYDKWYDEIVVTDDMDEMLLVSFVKQFNIPKEDFEKANEEWIKFITEVRGRTPVTPPFDTAHEAELCEVPNADVIYTFDNEFIKEYYKRENANVTLEIPTTVEENTTT